MKTIEISDTAYARLLELGAGLFSPSEVIDRLLTRNGAANPPHAVERSRTGRETLPGHLQRPARERGISVMVGDYRIDAVSVRDLFEKVLHWLVDEGGMRKIDASLPIRTSTKRYLLARKPVHPGGNDFIVPVTYKGYSMEAHKNYENAVSGLTKLSRVGGFPLRVIG